MSRHTPPVALTIAGFDTCAGAGLQADLLTFHNHGYHCLTAATCLVTETPLEVASVVPVSATHLTEQLSLLLKTYPVQTVKIGLLSSPDQVEVILAALNGFAGPIVLDPVGISTTGTTLQTPGTALAIYEKLAPRCSLITPNLPEALALLKQAEEITPQEAALALSHHTKKPVLLTGGHHGLENKVCDLLAEHGRAKEFCDSRIITPASLHGTGCVLSTALAAHLGKEQTLEDAVTQARHYLRQALQEHLSFPHNKPLLALNHL